MCAFPANILRTEIGIPTAEFFEILIVYFNKIWFCLKNQWKSMDFMETPQLWWIKLPRVHRVWRSSDMQMQSVRGDRTPGEYIDTMHNHGSLASTLVSCNWIFGEFSMIFIDFSLILMISWDIFCYRSIDIWTENYEFLWNTSIFDKSQLRAPDELSNFEI